MERWQKGTISVDESAEPADKEEKRDEHVPERGSRWGLELRVKSPNFVLLSVKNAEK